MVHISFFIQFSSVAQSCPTLCDSMNRRTPGLPVHHQLPEFTQTHIHRDSDAIQPSHPLSSPSPPAPNPSQHQSLFQWVNSSQEMAKVLEFSSLYSSISKKCITFIKIKNLMLIPLWKKILQLAQMKRCYCLHLLDNCLMRILLCVSLSHMLVIAWNKTGTSTLMELTF